MNADEWDERYQMAAFDPTGRLWSSVPHQVLQEIVRDLTPGRALDLAAGDGRNTLFLAGRGWQVTAVDFSVEAIHIARYRAEEAGLHATWIVADAREYRPWIRFELVVVTYLHLAEAENREVLSRAASWVAPGGHLLVLGHDKANLASGAPGPRNADILYTTDLLEGCAPGLDILRCEQVFRDSSLDPESFAEVAATAVDTLLYAVRPGGD